MLALGEASRAQPAFAGRALTTPPTLDRRCDPERSGRKNVIRARVALRRKKSGGHRSAPWFGVAANQPIMHLCILQAMPHETPRGVVFQALSGIYGNWRGAGVQTPDIMPELFSRRLRELRAARAPLSQEALGEAIGCDQTTIGRWEAGASAPSVGELVKLCDYFGVSADYLSGRVDAPSGLMPDTWLVDVEEYERNKPGGGWAAKVPRRLKIVDYETLRRGPSSRCSC